MDNIALFFTCIYGQENSSLAADSANPSLNSSSTSSSDNTISAQYSLAGTIIAAALAAGVGIYSAISNRKLQQDLTKLNIEQNDRNNSFQVELEKIKSNLALQKDIQAAKRDYEYEARKHLYEGFEPLLFQLHESSHRALERITQLAKDCSEGRLKPAEGWLSKESNFYMTMTLYLLLAPVGIFFIMSRHLTLTEDKKDLSFVPKVCDSIRIMTFFLFLTC